MSLSTSFHSNGMNSFKESRSQSVQGLASVSSSLLMKIPLPPRLWITDVEDESSDENSTGARDEGVVLAERTRVRSRFRHHKHRSTCNVPIGIFWDIENCQVPRGCSAIDVVAAIRAKFLPGRREAEFVVVCDVRKEAANRLQELNDSQVNLIHVCGTQKNAADEKLRQCMRRFGELHTAPAALLLISGDINFASDLSDFRHRKNMEVILVHKQNTSSALITCASSHYCYNELTAQLPRNPKVSQTEEEEPTCEMEVSNLPINQPPERVSRRLRRLADNCGGKVLRVTAPTAMLRFPTPDHASRALKRMEGEDVFGRKISTRFARGALQATYSSDEGYSTAPPAPPAPPALPHHTPVLPPPAHDIRAACGDWALALQQLPAPTPPPLDFCPPPAPAPKPRKIRGTHGSVSLDRSGCSSSNSGDESRVRAPSPWNSSSVSEHSDPEPDTAELTVSNLPPYEPNMLQEALRKLFSQYVPVVRVSVWTSGEGPLASVVFRSEWDARLAIARVHKRRLDSVWAGRRLELALGTPSPAPNLDVLRARLRAILLEQQNYCMPLLRLRDAYASRHCCSITTSDILKVKDTVLVHETCGRMVQLVDLSPVSKLEIEEAPWKCHKHSVLSTGHDDGRRILQPVFIELPVLARNIHILLESHGGILPLLSLVECYEAMFPALVCEPRAGVALELLLLSIPGVELKETPSRHLAWAAATARADTPPSVCNRSDTSRGSVGSLGERGGARTAPALEPTLSLFERDLVDLLRTAPRCTIPFSKLIPSYHHHFGRQCRVADYGFTKLPELLASLSNTIVVLGTGSYREITLSAAAQSRRWTSDLVKMLKANPVRSIFPHEIPQLYHNTFGRQFSPVDYGVCTIGELLQRTAPGATVALSDGSVALPRRAPTPAERAHSSQFALEAAELLCYTPNLRMEFTRFVPAYHAHYGRQLRVAHYGCVKLAELLDMIADTVVVWCEPNGEKMVRLAAGAARGIMAQRFAALLPAPFAELPALYAARFGAPPAPDVLDVSTLQELVLAAGGYIERGMAYITVGDAARLPNCALTACAVLSADMSVARGSTLEYFVSAFRRLRGAEPDLKELESYGVVETSERYVRLTAAWRTVWRLAQILADQPAPLPTQDVVNRYMKRYELSPLSSDLGVKQVQAQVSEVLQQCGPVFSRVQSASAADTLWTLAAGVALPPPLRPARHEDYSVHDTPPGQKGSRVFESPKTNIWCSPPASALPNPTALLSQENKRRTRLAAQFDAA
ncbi:meiosis regulator and mRNA stability factor 1 [Papilio machaon]|uniref:meiosis regulator and mRNA stability factor 1 n=1 Tax=Papilio machaon TaxID=76193 RepID=UPI001E663540|nr:meiosis regulator and mRNA stability factor 1 [Papilio machaon]